MKPVKREHGIWHGPRRQRTGRWSDQPARIGGGPARHGMARGAQTGSTSHIRGSIGHKAA